jgi:hypothetical protein
MFRQSHERQTSLALGGAPLVGTQREHRISGSKAPPDANQTHLVKAERFRQSRRLSPFNGNGASL